MQVFYSQTVASTNEELVVRSTQRPELDPAGLTSFLIFQCNVGTSTVWRGINKLYANSELALHDTGKAIQYPLSSLRLEVLREETTNDFVEKMRRALVATIRRATDSLDDICLPLSQGYDSRLLARLIRNPARIHAKTYALSQADDLDCDVAIARLIAADRGIKDHRVVSFEGDYSRFVPPALEHLGTTVSAAQAYLYGAAYLLNDDRLPLISGVVGDILSSHGATFARQWIETDIGPAERFKRACHCHAHEWKAIHLDRWLTFNWRKAIKPLEEQWASLWEASETAEYELGKATLIRLRNRGSAYLTGPWALADLWGGIVTPYYDRDYVKFMLSMPPKMLYQRIAQQRLLEWTWPSTWPHGNHPNPRSLCWKGTVVPDTITGNEHAFWPLKDGLQHRFFNKSVQALYDTAITGNTISWGLLASLQPIAWALQKGYGK